MVADGIFKVKNLLNSLLVINPSSCFSYNFDKHSAAQPLPSQSYMRTIRFFMVRTENNVKLKSSKMSDG